MEYLLGDRVRHADFGALDLEQVDEAGVREKNQW